MKLRDKNINTREYWNQRYFYLKDTPPPIKSIESFFDYKLLPENEEFSVLEIGCGCATHYPYLHEKFPKISWTGLDLSNFAYGFNKKNYKFANFIESNIDEDELEGVYDYIVSAHTFEHLNDPVKALEKCRKVTTKKVLLLVPYKDSWNYDPEHLHRFTEMEPLENCDNYIIHTSGGAQAIYFEFSGLAKK